MKTDPQTILSTLATLAPSIAFRTTWEPDHAPDWSIFHEGNGLHGEDPDDWQCWQSETTATAIVNGEPLTGSAYLGGTWERYGDDPAEVNPDVSGYLPQKLDDAAEDLLRALPPVAPLKTPRGQEDAWAETVRQIGEARAYLSAVMRARYDEQSQHLDAMAETAMHA